MSWRDRLAAPVDMAGLAAFRILFGILLAIDVGLYFAGDRIGAFWIRPEYRFPYTGFDWVVPWPGSWLYVHFGVLAALALAIAAGWRYRIVMPLFCAGFVHVFLLDQAQHLNHAYMICLLAFLMIFLPLHRAGSLDARSGRVQAATTAPAWTLWLLRFQVGLVYFMGGVAKFNADWLTASPLRMWLEARADWPLLGPLLAHDATAWFFAYAGLLFDLAIVPLLLWRRTRAIAFVLVCVFNFTNAYTFDIAIFPWLMLAGTALFFDPSWPRRLLPRLAGPPPSAAPAAVPARVPLVLLTLWVAIQLLVPLRHWLYPGNVNWTEEGHRFAWHMKLRSKQALALFYVTDPVTRRTRAVDPMEHLTPWQVHRMAGRPELLRLFADHLADEAVARGRARPEVRARVACVLNGHPARLLIDPRVDLAAQTFSWGHDAWILPFDSAPRLTNAPGDRAALTMAWRQLRAELVALERMRDAAAAKRAQAERVLADDFGLKPDGLYIVDGVSSNVFELLPRPGVPAPVGTVEDIDRHYLRRHHLQLVGERQRRRLDELLAAKQAQTERERFLDRLLAERELRDIVLLERLQDTIVAATASQAGKEVE